MEMASLLVIMTLLLLLTGKGACSDGVATVELSSLAWPVKAAILTPAGVAETKEEEGAGSDDDTCCCCCCCDSTNNCMA